MNIRILTKIALTFFTAGIALPAYSADDASNFPSKPIRLVVPFSAGGSSDIVGRLIGQKLSERYKQPVVVENKAGVAGNIGGENVARSKPDGYTLLVGLPSVHGSYNLYPNLNYDPGKELETLTVIGSFPSVVLVNAEVPAKNISELIKLAKESPDKLAFGSGGTGAGTHLAVEQFMQQTGVKMMHVPYKGSSAAATDLMGGQVQVMFENLPAAIPLTKSEKIKAIGVTSLERAPELPDLPTVAEQGVPGYEFAVWYTIAAPAGIPQPIAQKLSADLSAIIRSPELKSHWKELGITPMGGDLVESKAYVSKEAEKLQKLIKDLKLNAQR